MKKLFVLLALFLLYKSMVHAQTTFFSEDFSNTSSNPYYPHYDGWKIDINSANPTDVWERVTNPTFTITTSTFTFTHSGASNGYMLAGSDNEFYTTVSLLSPALNCSNQNTVVLSFVNRLFGDSAFVYASIDSVNWILAGTIYGSAFVKIDSLDISSFAGNAPQLFLKFDFIYSGNAAAFSAPDAWCIDDMHLSNTVCNIPNKINAQGNSTICSGDSLLISNSIIVSGLTYQWQLNGVDINGATQLYYWATAAGNYTCNISNACGNTTSNIIAVTTQTPITATITANGSTTPCTGGNTTFLYANQGAGLIYQWQLNNNPVGVNYYGIGATTAGIYNCIISNACGSFLSNSINISFLPQPLATISILGPTYPCYPTPVQYKANIGRNLTYQWTNSGSIIAGATKATYASASSGYYRCIVTNAFGCSTTSSYIFGGTGNAGSNNVVANATGATTFCAGDSVQLISTVAGSGTLQWSKNNFVIPGATSYNYYAKSQGNYRAYLNTSTCTVVSSLIVVTIPCVPPIIVNPNRTNQTIFDDGVNDINLEQLQNSLTISSPQKINWVIIADVTGKIILEKNVNGNLFNANTSQFSNGVYIVTVNTDNGWWRNKIILQK